MIGFETRKRRVVITYPPLRGSKFGGGEHTMLSAAQALEEKGYEISFIFRSLVDFSIFERNLGIKISSPNVFIYKRLKLPRIMKLCQHFVHPLLTPNIDADLFLNMSADSHPLAMPLKALINDKPIIYYFLGPLLDNIWMVRRYLGTIDHSPILYYRKVVSIIASKIFRKIHNNGLFLANSKYTAMSIKKACGLSSEVLYSPVEVNNYLWKEESKKNLIVASGRLIPSKNFERAIQAIRHLSSDVKLIIFGILINESYYNELLKLIERNDLSDRVKIVIGATLDERARILKKASVFLHCCVEGFGKVVVEAMAAGCVPVVPSVGGQAEFTPREFHYSSFEEMVQKVQEALEAPENLRWNLVSRSIEFDRMHYKKRFIEILQDKGLI